MRRTGKPDASYASNLLTRKNYRGGAPLSTVLGKKIRPEPEVNDEPLSTTDEASANDDDDDVFSDLGTGRKTRRSRPSLNQKLASSADELDLITTADNTNTGRTKTSGRKASAQTHSIKHGLDDDDELAFTFSQKRRKDRAYGKKLQLSSSITRQRSSLPSSSSSSSSSPPGDSSGGIRQPRSISVDKPGAGQSDGGSGPAFKVPMQMDLEKPGRGSRKPKHARKSSPEPAFRPPPPLLNDIIFSSSLAPSSAMNALIFEDDDDSPESPLTSLESGSLLSLKLSSDEDEIYDMSSSTEEARCPMCKAPVDPELLAEFLRQPRRQVRQQQRFCDSHTRAAAQKEYRDRGYPAIDWKTFDQRISKHFDHLDRILDPGTTSYYHNILDTSLKSGQAKNFKLNLFDDTLDTISCGYYGSRGALMMLEAVTKRFSRKIRRLAATDKVAMTAGVAVYAQNVLVPELVVQLIKEDMTVDDESARRIMRESVDVGEKVNFASNDVILVDEDDGNKS